MTPEECEYIKSLAAKIHDEADSKRFNELVRELYQFLDKREGRKRTIRPHIAIALILLVVASSLAGGWFRKPQSKMTSPSQDTKAVQQQTSGAGSPAVQGYRGTSLSR